MMVRFFFALIFILTSHLTLAQPVPLNTPWKNEVDNISYLVDETGKLTFDEVRKTEFETTQVLNFGFDDAVYWFSFEITNNSELEEWLLEIAFSPLDTVDFYIMQDSVWQHKVSGDMFAISVRDVRHQHPLFEFNIPQGETKKIFLRVHTTSSVQLPAVIWTTEVFFKRAYRIQLFNGMFYGAFVVMILYQLFLFVSTRDTVSLYYVFTLLAMGHVVSYFQGYSFLYAYPEYPQVNHIMAVVTGPLFLIFSTFLTRAFLNLAQTNKWLDRLLLLNTVIDVLAAILMLFFFENFSYRYHHYAILIHSSIALVAAAHGISNKFRPALYYLLSWLTLLVATLVFSLSNLGLFREYLNTSSSWLIVAGIVQMLLISFALGNRWNVLNRENQLTKEMELVREQMEKEKLELEVKIRTDEIQQQNERLEEVNRIKDKLFSIVSHDIKGPLTSLQLALGLVKSESITKEEFQELSHILETRFNQTTEFIQNLLQWASLQLKGGVYDPTEVDLKKIADETLQLLDYEIKNKGVILENHIRADLNVKADVNMLKSIFRNLVMNAVKFTRKGGTISLRAVPDASYVTVTVADTGIGIPKENQHKIFSLDSVTTLGTKQEKGTGLGLLLCKEFVERNNGSIWFDSEEGKGTEFHFTLPILSNNQDA